MSNSLDELKLFWEKSHLPYTHNFFIIKAKEGRASAKNAEQLLSASLNTRNKRALQLFLEYNTGELKQKYENHGLGAALTMYQFLFAFYKECRKTKIDYFKGKRGGKMYELLGMEKKQKKQFGSEVTYYKGEYAKEIVKLVGEDEAVRSLCKNGYPDGVTLRELISTYLYIGNKLKRHGFGILGNKLVKAAEHLKKRTGIRNVSTTIKLLEKVRFYGCKKSFSGRYVFFATTDQDVQEKKLEDVSKILHCFLHKERGKVNLIYADKREKNKDFGIVSSFQYESDSMKKAYVSKGIGTALFDIVFLANFHLLKISNIKTDTREQKHPGLMFKQLGMTQMAHSQIVPRKGNYYTGTYGKNLSTILRDSLDIEDFFKKVFTSGVTFKDIISLYRKLQKSLPVLFTPPIPRFRDVVRFLEEKINS